MNDELLMAVLQAGGDRWRSLLARAIAAHLSRTLASGDEPFEETAGRLEDALLDVACSLRAVNAARGGRGDQGEAFAEAGEAIVRLSDCLSNLRRAAIACLGE